MRRSRPLAGMLAVVGVLLAAGCSSSDDSTTPVTASSVAVADPVIVPTPPTASSLVDEPDTTPAPPDVTPTSPSSASTSTDVPPPVSFGPITTIPPRGAASGTEVPIEVGDVVLSDGFENDAPSWDETTWQVDTPGESSVASLDGVGVMETDLRGTHEWVRAVAPDSLHDNASLLVRITPVRSDEGTVFVGLHGDGEWRDATPYLPQTGVVVEYGYAEIFQGEIVIVVLDGTDEVRVGPVSGPVLTDGQSADLRFEWIDGTAHVRIWPSGTAEPATWDLETAVPDSDAGTVQLAYRDGVGRSMAFEELVLERLR